MNLVQRVGSMWSGEQILRGALLHLLSNEVEYE